MTKVYVVLGEQGDYSDHSEWIVGVFKTQAAANARALAARTRNQQLEAWERSRRDDPDVKAALAAIDAKDFSYHNHSWSEVNDFWRVPENDALQKRYQNLMDEAQKTRSTDPEMNLLDPSYVHRGTYGDWPDEYTVVDADFLEE